MLPYIRAPLSQATILAPILLVALGSVWALDRFVRPIDTVVGTVAARKKAYDRVQEGGTTD
jgi:hypothetical protein